jgi:hypothetical protein
MALGESRQVFHTNVDLSVSGVAERGGIISFDPVQAGNGIYADATAVSGQLVQPAGLLLDDVEALNFFEHPEYRQRNVVPQGSVVGLLTDGEGSTDFVETTLAGISVGTYAAGDPLYLADDGKLSRNNGTFGNLATAIRVRVGTALGTVDSDGFLRVRIDL